MMTTTLTPDPSALSISPPIGASEVVPPALAMELATMRRSPVAFAISGRSRCWLCPHGSKNAYQLSHVLTKDAGTWCSAHGWLYFPSNLIRPAGEEYVPKKKQRPTGARV